MDTKALTTNPQAIMADSLDDDNEEQIDLRQYWSVIRQHWRGIVGLAFMISLVTALIVWSMTPIYQATASLFIESKQSKVVSIEDIYAADTSRTEYLQSQFEILKSRELAKRVIEKLNLPEHPEFKEKPQSERFDWRKWLPIELPQNPEATETESASALSPSEKLIPAFQKRLTIAPVRNTQLVNISFESTDPELAMHAVNALGEAYIESNVEAKLQVTKQATDWIASRLEGLKTNLAQSERNLQDFLEKQNLVNLEGVFTLASKEVGAATEKLVEIRQTRAEAENVKRQIEALGNDLPRKVDSIPEIYADPVVQQMTQKLAELRGTESELSKRYGPYHPKIIGIHSEIESIEDSLRKQVSSLVEGVTNRYEVAQSNEAALQASIEMNKSEIQDISRKQAQFRELQREIESNKNLYEMFFNRLKETKEAGDLQPANARFVDRAFRPAAPVKPKKTLSVVLAFVASLIVGVMLAFLIEQLDNSFKDAGDLEKKLGVPLLGLLPLIKPERKGEALNLGDLFLREGQSSFGEAIRTIRTGVLLSGLDLQHKVIAVTSSQAGEGKTTLVLNLAFALAQMQKVLLIDADMRRPSIAKILGFNSRSPGLSDLLAHTSGAEICIQKFERGKLDVICAGAIPPNPLEMLSSQRFSDFIKEYESSYDVVLIDSPPVQAVSDGLMIAKVVNTLIYVVKAESTPVRAAKDGLGRLYKAHAPVCGVVLNHLDTEKASKYGDYYGAYYYQYGYSSSKESS
ncbi:MAG: polysaccharide biosynthesis tyrosine autokinase [Methylococcaceae bacterium]|nr:polysaccharide biosynthesis tyrosine autokinase [Methylococcaceae bacterium]